MYKDVICPVTHEFGAYLKVLDLDLYYATVGYFKSQVSDPYKHYITCDGRKFKFWSKQGGLFNPKTNKLAFEYLLHWEDHTKASKCHIAIKPMFGVGTKTKYGKTLNLPDIGVNIEIKCSYLDLYDDILPIFRDFLKEIDASRFEDSIDYDRSRIDQFARHIRYHERHETDVVNMLKAIKKESSIRGDYHLIEDRKGGMYDMYKLDVPSFDVCNIQTEYAHSVKSYRIRNFQKRTVSDPLRHPKFEVFLNPKETERKNDKRPSLHEYDAIRNDLDDSLAKLLNFVGPLEYIPDEYFDPLQRYTPRFEFPKWNYKQSPAPAKVALPDNLASLRFLSFVAFNKNGFADFRDIVEYTGIPERSAWRYLEQFRILGLIDTIRDKITRVFFKKESTWKNIKDALIKLSNYMDFGYKNVYGYIMYDTKKVRAWKDRDKNLIPMFQHNHEVVRVDTQKDYDRLKKEFDALGIVRRLVLSGMGGFRAGRYRL